MLHNLIRFNTYTMGETVTQTIWKEKIADDIC